MSAASAVSANVRSAPTPLELPYTRVQLDACAGPIGTQTSEIAVARAAPDATTLRRTDTRAPRPPTKRTSVRCKPEGLWPSGSTKSNDFVGHGAGGGNRPRVLRLGS